ncbi:MAG: porin family protein [Prevotellaceae bacterium]|jgi:outer membrane protein W|nr:porin family protein [Prevotellaceae bacterium]
MKKILAVLMIVLSVKANAQFFAGIEAKAGISNLVTTDSRDNGFSYFAGAHAGYEFFKHIPVSIGVEYGELKIGENPITDMSHTSLRIPLKVGYCHYFGRLKPFANIGAFLSTSNILHDKIEAAGVYDGTITNVKGHFGYLGQIGIGYKIIDRLTISIAYEHSRPFNRNNETNIQGIAYPGFYFSGAVISASIYF